MPRFTGHSYMALPMVKDLQLFKLRLLFKPVSLENVRGSSSLLVLYSTNKFVLTLDESGRVELRYLSDSDEIIRVIGSKDVELFKWNELIIIDSSTENQFNIDDDTINRISLITPDKIQLDNPLLGAGELFVGGLPDSIVLSNDRLNIIKNNENNNMATETTMGGKGFVGCIKEFTINHKDYNLRSDLNGDTLDGFDIGKWSRTISICIGPTSRKFTLFSKVMAAD